MMDTSDYNDNGFGLLFLGTGASTALPELGHVLRKTCNICMKANTDMQSKNRRNNVSIALVFKSNDGTKKCVMIDAGKTVRNACMQQFPRHNIDHVDSIILTHGHADAMLGLDDLRDLQITERAMSVDGQYGCRIKSGPLHIYLHDETMSVVKNCFDYLLKKPEYFPDTDILQRRVALLQFNVIDPSEHLNLYGLSIKCFPVYHGGTYISLGFSIGQPGQFVYISDVKIIPPETWEYLKSISPIQLLVIDVLNEIGLYSHLGLHEALEIIKELQPVRTLFTGMSCTLGDHDEVCERLHQIDPSISLAYDGLCINGLHR